MCDGRRPEEDEVSGSRFSQQILDTNGYQDNAQSACLNYLPGNNDED
ncbi:unnamed protein product, partial [Rotaria sp. Silwood2]